MTSDVIYNLDLFGTEFPLKTTDGNRDELIRVSEYYKKVVHSLSRKSPKASSLHIAVLAGIIITDELYNLARQKNTQPENVRREINDLLNEAIKQLEVSISL
jgi:cell division protein ZapA (FtsZ GTPase activity inhibitor)